MRGATQMVIFHRHIREISTHTPHAGRDQLTDATANQLGNFYSHAPCGARLKAFLWSCRLIKFLLTRPMRGATSALPHLNPWRLFLLTRPMRGATNELEVAALPDEFLLTRPMRGATFVGSRLQSAFRISTHTPHAGRDAIRGRDHTSNLFLLTRPMRGATATGEGK